MLSLNLAVWVQIVLFISVVLICGPLLIRPTMRLLDERREHTEGTKARAKELESENDARLRTIEEKLGSARKEGQSEREKIRLSKAQQAEALITEAKNEARKEIEEMRKRIDEETETARKTLRMEINVLAKAIAGRLLGREVA